MDLPKELLQKYLPKKKQDSEKSQHASGVSASQSRTSSIKASNKGAEKGTSKKCPPVLSKVHESTDVADEDALFMQAMHGMVRKPSKKNVLVSHGAFPLAMPEPTPALSLLPIDSTVADSSPPVSPSMAIMTADNASKVVPAINSGADSGEDAFALAMRTVQPLTGKGRDILPPVVAVDAAVLQSHALLANDIVFDVQMAGESVQGQVVGLDPKMLMSLASGSQSPEARLDLHGMNAAQAFQALVPFFKISWHKGLRIVIVVTGRGINSPSGMAVLRQKLASWLTQEPFNQVVMAFSTAQPCDGGTGSMYVLLRKFRKKHPVHWERTPVDSDIF